MKEQPRYVRTAQPLSRLVEHLTRPVRRKRGLAEARILTDWHTIVGAALAQNCLPIKLQFARDASSGGTLHVVCESAWALELQYQEPVVLDRIASFFGYRAVDRLVIRQAPLPKTPAKSLPIETVDAKDLPDLPVAVEDAELQLALRRLGHAINSTKRP